MLTGILSSCKKYDEGPRISLRSKTERLSNTWRVDQATLSDGQDVLYEWENASLEFKKDGSYAFIQFSPDQTMKAEEKGSWVYTNRKEQIITTGTEKLFDASSNQFFDETSTNQFWIITRLKEKELWLWIFYNNGLYQTLKLKPLE